MQPRYLFHVKYGSARRRAQDWLWPIQTNATMAKSRPGMPCGNSSESKALSRRERQLRNAGFRDLRGRAPACKMRGEKSRGALHATVRQGAAVFITLEQLQGWRSSSGMSRATCWSAKWNNGSQLLLSEGATRLSALAGPPPAAIAPARRRAARWGHGRSASLKCA